MPKDQPPVELDLRIMAETANAYLVTEDEKNKEYWLPKSQIDISDDEPEVGKIYSFLIPEWLAIEKGLV